MTLTSQELLRLFVGNADYETYVRVKQASMMLGKALTTELFVRVGGRELPTRSKRGDGETKLGVWEACIGAKSKNAGSRLRDWERCPGRCVQILDRPYRDDVQKWTSGHEYFLLHGHREDSLDMMVLEVMAVVAPPYKQLVLL
jgi:hypothetical protein